MTNGQAAPFTGVLLRDADLAALLTEIGRVKSRAAADIEAVRAEAEARARAAAETAATREAELRGKLEAETAARLRDAEVYRRALGDCAGSGSSPWYRDWVPILGGVLVGGGVCAGTAAAFR